MGRIVGYGAAAIVCASVLSGWIWTASDGEREQICRPGYSKSQRMPFHEYVLARNEAFRRAGIPITKQCKKFKEYEAVGGGQGEESCYILDHIVPLCLGGGNGLDNLQVQTHTDAKVKDDVEIATCRAYCKHTVSLADAVRRFGRARP
jgi:hypothetical protein